MLVNQNEISVSSFTIRNHTYSSYLKSKESYKTIKNKSLVSFQKLYVYWNFDEGASIEKMFFSRNFRPNEELKRILKDEYISRINNLLSLNLTHDDIELSWNKYCGCSMCPCSPGYKVYFNSNNVGQYFHQLKQIESTSFTLLLKEKTFFGKN